MFGMVRKINDPHIYNLSVKVRWPGTQDLVFGKFKELPPELRIKIWTLLLPKARAVEFQTLEIPGHNYRLSNYLETPPNMPFDLTLKNICIESRRIFFENYQLVDSVHQYPQSIDPDGNDSSLPAVYKQTFYTYHCPYFDGKRDVLTISSFSIRRQEHIICPLVFTQVENLVVFSDQERNSHDISTIWSFCKSIPGLKKLSLNLEFRKDSYRPRGADQLHVMTLSRDYIGQLEESARSVSGSNTSYFSDFHRTLSQDQSGVLSRLQKYKDEVANNPLTGITITPQLCILGYISTPKIAPIDVEKIYILPNRPTHSEVSYYTFRPNIEANSQTGKNMEEDNEGCYFMWGGWNEGILNCNEYGTLLRWYGGYEGIKELFQESSDLKAAHYEPSLASLGYFVVFWCGTLVVGIMILLRDSNASV